MKAEKGPERKKEKSKDRSWNKIRDGWISAGRAHHKRGDEWPLSQRNEASSEEELWDYEEDEKPVIPTPSLKASPEALGVWKRAQKMLAEACKEMAIYQQMTERPRAQSKAWEEDMVKSVDLDDPSLPDTMNSDTKAGCKDRCFRCGSTQHATAQCPVPGGHWIYVLTDKTMEKRERSEQVEFQMKLAILQKINPRIARKPGPPRKKRPRKTVPLGSSAIFTHVPDPKEEIWLNEKNGGQKQVIFRDIIPAVTGRLEESEDFEAIEASMC